jgi:hypothetical protein
MSSVPDLATLLPEIELGVGRNLLLYQRIELNLKELDRLSRISGFVSEFPKVFAEAREKSKGHTMGGAVSRFLEQAASELLEGPVELKGDSIYIGFHWNIGDDDQSRGERDQRMRSVLEDRNRLVHEIGRDFDLGSRESCGRLVEWLDSARAAAIEVDCEVKAYLDAVILGLKISTAPEAMRLMIDPTAEFPGEF